MMVNILVSVGGLIIYFAILFIIGFARSKGIGLQEYIADKSNTNFLFVLCSLLGTIVGGGMFFAVSQIGYEAGTIGYVIGISYFIGFCIMGVLVPKIRNIFKNKGILTLTDFINNKYKDYSWSGIKTYHLFAFINFVLFFFMLAAQFVILIGFIRIFYGVSIYGAIVIAAFVLSIINIFSYTFIGGIRKDIATDVFQFIIISISAVLISIKIFNPSFLVAIRDLSADLPASFFIGTGYGKMFMIGSLLFLPLTFIVRFDFWQRIATAKKESTASWAFFLAAPFCLFFYVLFTTIGMYGKTLGLSVSKEIIGIEILNSLFSGPTYIFVLLGVFAAVMSSADTFLNVASINMARLFHPQKWEECLNGKNSRTSLFSFLKNTTLGIGFASIIIALIIPNIVDLFVGAFSCILILAPATILAIFKEKPSSKGAFHSILWGFSLFLLLFILFPSMRKFAFIPGIFLSILISIIMEIKNNK